MMMCMSSSMGIGAALVTLGMVSGGMGRLGARAYDGAPCTAPGDWSWMDNQQHKNPCVTVAFLQGACVGKGYSVPPLQPNEKYNSPDLDNVTACYCSWAVYNLYSACESCQAHQSSILSWAAWNTNCSAFPSTTGPWPARYSQTPDGTTFPRWAAQDPRNWTDGRWNLAQAQQLANTVPGDAPLPGNQTTTTTKPDKKETNVGAIAGGVVGGVVAIAIGVAVALLLFCRNKRRKARQSYTSQTAMAQTAMDHQHARSPSDLSAKTYGTNFGYAPLGHTSSPSTGSTGRAPASPTTFFTHNSSRASFTPHESLLASTAYAGTPPPQGVVTPPNVYITPHGAVAPFTLDRPSSAQDTSSGHGKKRSEASAHQVDASGSGSNPAQTRSPMNPPAYSEAPHGHGDFSSQAPDQVSTYGSSSIITTPQSTPGSRPHEKNPSVGSMGSHRSDASSTGYWTHTNSTSLSGAADLLNHMGSGTVPGPSTPTPAYIGPGPNMNVQRDEKRRPVVMNVTPADTGNHERQE